MKRILIVANRLPVNVKIINDEIVYHQSAGGLATGLNSLEVAYEKHWIGWPGIYPESEKHTNEIRETLEKSMTHPVFLTEDEVQKYYEGFSNKTIWPLFHYFLEYTQYNRGFWEEYKSVNQAFCDKVIEVARPDDIIWVHDYHLMLLPQLLRQHLPHNQIGFFLHIPFPSYELIRTLPWRKEILEGLLGADLVGFHTFEYLRHFTSSISRILNLEPKLGRVYKENRVIQIDSFPMGIDYHKFNNAIKDEAVQKQVDIFIEKFGKGKIILSVDRLDYTKGILQRLLAFDKLLTEKPEFKGKISLILLVVPSRYNVGNYKDLKEEIDKAVGHINGKYSNLEWTPIYYLYRAIPFKDLAALYYKADIALVTPFRDGMNLVAKEYVASKSDGTGVLILSEMAGSAIELSETICVNPNDVDNIVHALEQAIKMPEDEQKIRMENMQKTIKKQSIQKWAKDFISVLENIHLRQLRNEEKEMSGEVVNQIKQAYKTAKNKLILLDYDGTLVPYIETPKKAIPDEDLLKILDDLSGKHGSSCVIVSGRDHENLQKWFNDSSVEIIAEYGSWFREENKWTQTCELPDDWKEEILSRMQEFVDKTPGSFIEEKSHSLGWHYRKSDPWLANLRVQEFINAMIYPCTKLNVEIIEGNKVIEIRISGVSKDSAIEKWLQKEDWDFIMAIGDDQTDEDMFKLLPDTAYSIKVGYGATHARYNLCSSQDVRKMLTELPI